MPLVFLHLFPLLVNCGFRLGESWKCRLGMQALDGESSKVVSQRGWECQHWAALWWMCLALKLSLHSNLTYLDLGTQVEKRCVVWGWGDVKEPCSSAHQHASAMVYVKGDHNKGSWWGWRGFILLHSPCILLCLWALLGHSWAQKTAIANGGAERWW